jgi:hypothetical protein
MPFPIFAAMAINSALQAAGGKSAASAQEDAANQAGALSRQAFDYTRSANLPYTNLGSQAANTLGSVYGYSPSDPASIGYGNSPFLQSDYQKLSALFPQIRSAANWNDINWDVIGGKPQLTAGVEDFISANWRAIRPAANFQDINWNAGTGYSGGTPIGYKPAERTGMPGVSNYEAFFASPDYQFRQQQGTKNINNWLAARGGGFSGNALKALTEFNSNLASGEYGNWFNRQLGLTNMGQNANAQNSAAGTNSAALSGAAAMAAGDARASGVMNTTNSLQNTLYDSYDILKRRRNGTDGNRDYWNWYAGNGG